MDALKKEIPNPDYGEHAYMEKQSTPQKHHRVHSYHIVLFTVSLLALLCIVLLSIVDTSMTASVKQALFIVIGVPALIIFVLTLAMIYISRMPTVRMGVHPVHERPWLWLWGGTAFILLGLTNGVSYFTTSAHFFMQLPGALGDLIIGLSVMSSGIVSLRKRKR